MSQTKSSRVHLVDVLRLVALLQMVNGHTLDAVIAPSVRDASWFPTYDFFRGLVSVAFMLASGIAFHLTRISRLPEQGPLRDDPVAARTRVRRMLEIIVIGYLLRAPLGALSDDPEVVARSWAYFFQIDVLPCIGGSLLILEGLSRLLVHRRRVRAAAFALGALTLTLAPLTDGLGTEMTPLTAWLSHAGGSVFPLLPWGGYVFFGAVLGGIVFPEAGRTPARTIMARLALLTVVASLTSAVLWRSPVSLWAESQSYHAMPAFFVEKLAWVLGLLALLAPLMARVTALPKPLEILAGETLSVYVFHLLVLFFPPMLLASRIGPTLPLADAVPIAAAMVLASAAFGLLWSRYSPRAWARRARERAAVADAGVPAE